MARKGNWNYEKLQELLLAFNKHPATRERPRIIAAQFKLRMNDLFILLSAAQQQKAYKPIVYYENGVKITKYVLK